MPQLRDTRRPLDFWNEQLEIKHDVFHSQDSLAQYNERLERGDAKGDAIKTIKRAFTYLYLQDITYTYCRGDDLDEIKRKYIDIGIDRYIVACDELDKYQNEMEEGRRYWEDSLFYPNAVHSAYSMLSWFVCFGADEKKLERIAPYLVRAGEDRLVDTILQRYQPDRQIATEDKCGRTFKLLQSVLDVDEGKAIKNLEKYLASWGKLMGTLKGLESIGLTGTRGAKSNESLIANLDTIKNISYRGFWAWEVALVVRCFGIDDSSFCDHEFYPKDLAHYRPGS